MLPFMERSATSRAISYCWFLVALLQAFPRVAAIGPLKNNHEVLGLTRAATFEDIQYAYQKHATKHAEGRNYTAPPEKWFVDIHEAYEAISNKEMHDDCMRFVDYWGDVALLKDDVELRRFAEFQPGGSSRLRVLVIMSYEDERHYEVYSSSIKLGRSARVAQIRYGDALSPSGEPADFLATLKLKQQPAAVLFDPITRGMKVRYGLDGIGVEIERLLTGSLSSNDKIGWIQEYDIDSFEHRCGAEEHGNQCEATLLFVSNAAYELKRNELVNAIRPFMDACRNLQANVPTLACFWLRSGRAPEWEKLLQEHGLKGEVGIVAQDFGVKKLSVAPANVVSGSAEEISAWASKIKENNPERSVPQWPDLPKSVRPDEEPKEEEMPRLLRKIRFHALCILYSECRSADLEILKGEAQLAIRRWGWETYLVQLKSMDSEMLSYVAAGALFALMVLFAFCRFLCCRRRARLTEEDAVNREGMLVKVSLTRPQAGYGIEIESHVLGGLLIKNVVDGGALAAWNQQESRPEYRVRAGDRIVAAGSPGTGPNQSSAKKIVAALGRDKQEVVLAIALTRSEKEVQCICGTMVLEGMTLMGACETAPPAGITTGSLEVTKISPELERWNAARSADGSCCSQRLEVGDRIVSANGSLDIGAFAKDQSVALLILRWRSASAVHRQRIEVTMEKFSAEDRVGMQIRRRVVEPKQMEVLEVVPTGLLAAWNNNPANAKVYRGDRIFSVNGAESLDKIQEELKQPKITIVYERWADGAGNGSGESASKPVLPPTASAGGMYPPTVATPTVAAPTAPTGAFPNPVAAPTSYASSAVQSFVPPQNLAPQPPNVAAPVSAAPPQSIAATPRFTPPPMVSAPVQAPIPVTPVVSADGSGFIWKLLLSIAALAAAGALGGAPPSEPPQGELSVAMPAQAKAFMEKIHPELYFDIALLLMLVGSVLTLLFLHHEVAGLAQPYKHNTPRQLFVAAMASMFLGVGIFFLLAWAGIYK